MKKKKAFCREGIFRRIFAESNGKNQTRWGRLYFIKPSKRRITLTKKFNKGSRNQGSPEMGNIMGGAAEDIKSGDDSKGNKRNKDQRAKTIE